MHNFTKSLLHLLMAFVLLSSMLALCSAATQQRSLPSGDGTRMVLLGTDDDTDAAAWMYLLGQRGWIQQPQPPPVFGAAPRNRFLPPVSRTRKWGGKRALEDEEAKEVEKKWSRFEPSIRFV